MGCMGWRRRTIMGERFKHLNEEAAMFILNKTHGREISNPGTAPSLYYEGKTLYLHYFLFKPLTDHNGQNIPPTLTYTSHIGTIYQYKLTLYSLYSLKFPEYLNPDNQQLPHEWVWKIHYEETL